MPNFSKRSINRLKTCDHRLKRILLRVIKRFDCTVLEGHRTEEKQNEYYWNGKSKLMWPESKHNSEPSLAVDVAPWPIPENWGEDWRDRVKFYELKALIFYEAAEAGVKIRFGGDWDMDEDYKDQTFNDLVHFEIVE